MAGKKVDLNCDMGESFGRYKLGMDSEVMPSISSCNVACGFHAGDPLVINRTVQMAAQHGAGVGAHPGFPDLLGFGRRNMECTLEEIKNYVIYQIGAVQAFCAVHGVRLQHVKPHGSLYNMIVGNEPMARTVTQAVASVDRELLLVTLAGKEAPMMSRIAREEGIKVAFEGFPDRAYTPEGTLLPRRLAGAVIEDADQAAERALRMASEGEVTAVDGTRVKLEVHTLCVHGDTPTAVQLVRRIRSRLEEAAVSVRPLRECC